MGSRVALRLVGDDDPERLRYLLINKPAGVVTTVAGQAGSTGSDDGTGSAARFYQPYGVVVDSGGNVLVADLHNRTIRKVTPEGMVIVSLTECAVADQAKQFLLFFLRRPGEQLVPSFIV